MPDIEYALTINRRPEDVFAFVTDPANDHLWWKSVIQTDKLTSGELGVGSELLQRCRVMGIFNLNNHIQVAEYFPPHTIRYETQSNLLPYSALYRFEPLQDGVATRFHIEATLTPKGALKQMLPLLMWTLAGDLKRYFLALKLHLEAEVERDEAAGVGS